MAGLACRRVSCCTYSPHSVSGATRNQCALELLFFGWHLGGLAFADIILLWVLIVATLTAFWRVRPLGGALLIPYLLWVSFASALNYSVWQLNPQILG
mgnify:CR=1 FL=1